MRAFPDEEILDFLTRFHAEMARTANMWTDLPFLTTHITPELRGEWPRIPWFVRKVLLPAVFARRYPG